VNQTPGIDTTQISRPKAATGLSWSDGIWLAAIVAIGLNLRPLLTSVSPLMATIRAATGLSFSGASLLTSLPVVAMGFGALGVGMLTRIVGETRGVALGLLGIALACGARFTASSGVALLMTALLAGIGVAAIQALLPGVMKRRFHARVPLAMGLFSASIMGGGGLGASLSPYIARAFDSWHAGLAVWAAPAALAGACWLVLHRSALGDARAVRAADPLSRAPHVAMWRKRRAWSLGLHFGLVNGGYTTLVAWLPAYYQQRGTSVAHSGSLLAAMTVFQAASALLLPLAASSFRDRRPWLVAGLSAQLLGIVGLLAFPDNVPLAWVAIAGAGLGGFSLTLVTALDHADDHRIAGRLVAFVQGIGFIVAAISPVIAGRLRDLTGSFSAAWIMLAVCIAAMIALTFAFSPRSYKRWLWPR